MEMREQRQHGVYGLTVKKPRLVAWHLLCLLIALALVGILLAGCGQPTPTPPISPTSPPAEPTLPSAPITGPASTPPTDTRPPSVTPKEEEEIDFVWMVESGVRLEDATIPYIHRLADGRFRMYYGGAGGILSAISEDGLTFQKEAGIRVPSGSPGSPEVIVSDPTLVGLKDGRMRMYYKGASGPGGPGQSVHSIFSAISSDGLNFEKESIRIDSQQTSDRGWASVPEAIVLPDGRVRIYYVSDGLDVKHGIVSAISSDGLNFTKEETKLTGFVDPALVRLADGRYLMVAIAFPLGPEGRLTDAEPGIYSFTSQDGIDFNERRLVLAGENNIDPTIVDIGEGVYRIYYWNAMEQPPAIKSITGRLK